MSLYSLSDRSERVFAALFTITLLLIASLNGQAQEKAGTEFFGTVYGQGGYQNSILNLNAEPAAARSAGSRRPANWT